MGPGILDLVFMILCPIIGAIAVCVRIDQMRQQIANQEYETKKQMEAMKDEVKDFTCKTYLDLQFNRIKGYKEYKDN